MHEILHRSNLYLSWVTAFNYVLWNFWWNAFSYIRYLRAEFVRKCISFEELMNDWRLALRRSILYKLQLPTCNWELSLQLNECFLKIWRSLNATRRQLSFCWLVKSDCLWFTSFRDWIHIFSEAVWSLRSLSLNNENKEVKWLEKTTETQIVKSFCVGSVLV